MTDEKENDSLCNVFTNCVGYADYARGAHLNHFKNNFFLKSKGMNTNTFSNNKQLTLRTLAAFEAQVTL